MSVPIAVTIAGSDSSGGAGIEADLKTFSALGVYGACVITALTAQNTKGVFAIHDVPADFIAAQINAVFADLDVGAVKIGMLANAPAIDVVAAALDRYRPRNVVLDPVMIASSGERLLREDAIGRLRDLVGRARALTPNLPEAAALLDATLAHDEAEMRVQAVKLLALGAGAVLIKGGHGSGPESVDLLVEADTCLRLAAPRVATKNTHGTGCTLASALAAGLAKGLSLEQAARQAKSYVSAAIAAADRLAVGSGRGPLHHFHAWW
ncbi:MAG TPA: bifunctional hydroxymethylpyrimidine kinase/phosphomethylpyrimidine kinase [Xanthobacteraceae bacterium]|nr:bifunctional hydroxymethylpyrimidine kinase/phosphomethylpyrimidine kinase [Xanthobacteraceae bacterium]